MDTHHKGTLFVLTETFRRYRSHLFLLAILGIASAVLEGIGVNAIIPLFSFLLGDGAATADPISNALRALFDFLGVPFTLRFLLVFITALFLVRAVAVAVFSYIRARISASFMYREMRYLLSATFAARWSFLANQKTGYLQNTLFWDVRQSMSLLDTVAQFIQSGTGFFMYLIVAFSISPFITLITLVAGSVLLFGLQPLVRKTTIFGEEKSGLEKGYANHLVEYLSGLKTVKASGVGVKVEEAGRHFLEKMRTVYTKSAIMHSVGTTIIQPFSFIFILVLFAIAYKLPDFNLAAFIAVLYLIQKIFTYLQSAQSSLHSISDFIPFASNILHFKNLLNANKETMIAEAGKSFSFSNSLSFKGVSFSYRTGTPVLSRISFSIPRNSFLGIIGPSGGGKTSVADIILRLFPPAEGSVFLDDTPIDSIRLDEWQTRVGYVSQDIFLIHASVRDNIKFYNDSALDADVEEAARYANIYDDIMRLPHGFDTIVGERGATLSGGQRQRIVLARALARKPAILVLDEATSALDSESERVIKETIESIREKVTLIVIAHRISTITSADNIIVLKDGSVVEEGKPSDMLNNPNSYLSHMMRLQSHQRT